MMWDAFSENRNRDYQLLAFEENEQIIVEHVLRELESEMRDHGGGRGFTGPTGPSEQLS